MSDDVIANPSIQSSVSLVEEHRTIRAAVRLVETAPDLVTLLQRLHALRELLVLHFLNEEAPDGFFDTMRELASRHIGKVAALSRDHQTFLARIADLEHRAHAVLAGPVAETLRAAGDLAQRIRDHEATENELLVDGLYVDIGDE
jgi:hypothetical protein